VLGVEMLFVYGIIVIVNDCSVKVYTIHLNRNFIFNYY